MRVLHLTMHENTGAGYAVKRLHQGLIKKKLDSIILVSQKASDLSTIVSPKNKTSLYKKIQPRIINRILDTNSIFSINITPSLIYQQIEDLKPEILHLHWVGWDFLRIEDFKKFNVPLIWTLHDMWAFTGGCHYSGDCDRYSMTCGSCPQLQSHRDKDISRWVWQRKAKAWKDLNLTIVTPSHWLSKCAKASSLLQKFRIEVIPNGVDVQRYKPIDRQIAKSLLGLPPDKQIVMFGAIEATSDHRKGFHLLLPALQKLSQLEKHDQVELVIFGASQPTNAPDFGLKTHYLGKLSDEISLPLIYSAADVFVAPSLQDNLPNTIIEALACGTPCVAFKVGGIIDMIEHQQNGYLAQPYVLNDLALGIAWVIQNNQRWHSLSKRAREKVNQKFTIEMQASAYLKLYSEVLKGKKLSN